MAIDISSTPAVVAALPVDAVPAIINGYEADASTAVELIAAPGVSKTIFLLEALITCDDDDCDPQLQDEDDNVLFGPFFAKVAGPIVVHKKWEKLIIKLVSNKALEVKAAAAGTFSIYLEYAIGSGS